MSLRGDPDDCEVVARNQLPELGRVVAAFQEFAERRALPDAVRRRAMTAVDEVLNNVISYAYPEDGERVITIRFADDRRQLTVTVQDDGVAFDPLAQAAPDTSTTLEEREAGGLGIHIVRKLANDVRYERQDEKNLLSIDFLYEREEDGWRIPEFPEAATGRMAGVSGRETIRLDLGQNPEDDTSHYLLVTSGETAGRLIEIGRAALVLGYSEECDVRLICDGVSGKHCRVALRAGTLFVQDLKSTNGVYIGDKKIRGADTLSVGALMRIGRVTLRHELRDAEVVQQQESLDAELNEAADYVRSLLPQPLDDSDVRIDWRFLPSRHLGGDAFGYHRIGDGRLALYLIDVCGHGPGAALHSVSVINVLRAQALTGVDFGRPGAVLAALNETFDVDRHGDMFFTIWYGLYDTARRRLDSAAAGHPPPLVVRADGSSQRLEVGGIAAGLVPGTAYTESGFKIAAGDRVYLFSDGVFEVPTSDGTMWSRQGFEHLVQSAQGAFGGELKRIERGIRGIMRDDVFDDDFSLVVAEFR